MLHSNLLKRSADEMAQIILEIKTNDSPSIVERRFAPELTISELKNRLELITGASSGTMEITFQDTLGNTIGKGDDSKCLRDYLVPNAENRLRLIVKDPNVIKLDDLSDVPKYEMNDEEYAKRDDSVLAFKMRNKLGRFANQTDDAGDEDSVKDIKVGDRCEVTVKNMPSRRGTVMYVGKLGNLNGQFIGVRYDEPWGKNDGTFDGVRYFECQPNYGSFVKPHLVNIGDYPPLDDGLD